MVVSQTGEKKRLTYFGTTYSAAAYYNVEWSSDGSQIAFMEQIGTIDIPFSDAIPQLMVVDVESGDVTNYCVTGSSPIWSADGKYILITQRDEEKQYHVFLIDLQTAQAWEIAQDAYARGWMVPEP